ncbi:MAG TPA: hypothetical protein VH682_00010 [Gemmataceae bacterium]
MPLLDHFNPPLSRTHPWRSFHGAWAAAMARLLNQGVLPPSYYALPLVDQDGPSEAVKVQVFADDSDLRLTAAVELVSPRNKDHPQARQAFAAKCVSCLQQGSGVVVVDTVTTRRADLNAAILALLGVENSAAPASNLSAVSYRAVGHEEETQQLLLWPAPLALGQSLPTLPLWIASDFSVPLDLEASYQTTCTDLRICQAG